MGTKRCFNCNKKVGLFEMICKCEKTFCIKCRHPIEHKCEFDEMEHTKRILEKNNPKIENEKFERM
jgi:hypothetical protein